MPSFGNYLPILDWGRRYDRQALANDLIAALIVTIMLIPSIAGLCASGRTTA